MLCRPARRASLLYLNLGRFQIRHDRSNYTREGARSTACQPELIKEISLEHGEYFQTTV